MVTVTRQEEVLRQHCVRKKRISVFYVILVLAGTDIDINTERFAGGAQKKRLIAGGKTSKMRQIDGHTKFRNVRVCSLAEQCWFTG